MRNMATLPIFERRIPSSFIAKPKKLKNLMKSAITVPRKKLHKRAKKIICFVYLFHLAIFLAVYDICLCSVCRE